MAGASAQKEINESTGKIVRLRGDVANTHFEPLARGSARRGSLKIGQL
jgi:hypothetical protein